ncbi:MAG TPA: DUF1206 domain-containing protein [Longimicrobium sp.]
MATGFARRARGWTRTPRARAFGRIGQHVGRAGYVAKGVLYALVGALAMDAGVRPYDPLAGARGALLWIGRQWLGQMLAGVLAAGLFAYVLWLLVQSVLDPLQRAHGLRGVAFRAVCVVSAVLYGTLALQGIRLLAGGEVDPEQRRRALVWMRTVLDRPMGRWGLFGIGLGVLAYSAAQLLRALRRPSRSLDLSGASATARRRVVLLARAGLAARGAVAAIIAWFTLRASVLYEPSELLAVAGALRVVREQPHGAALLVAMGAGLAAYGVLQVLRAWYWEEPER